MKTPENIKKGLEACIAGECNSKRIKCPYRKENDCTTAVVVDAFALIQQLEAKLAECGKNLMCRSCANCAHNVGNHLSEYCRDCDCGSNWEEADHAER